ncbi:BadF/BadG/BcrA/BcrD ATPase family protein [Pokkaliibacter sp. CJK22405]|uniref:BadF/BadG/BcrA/BcrD ATPase family protein n=1 Tax=Pokkaliibacter sp. CJK22405 TaxID=3384615 RepID=UPI003984DE3B
MDRHYLVGIDGGGTSCRARLTDIEGNILGEAKTGTANPRAGLEQAWHNITASIAECFTQAGLPSSAYANTAVGLGLAGTNQLEEQRQILSMPHRFARVNLFTDAHAACLGAFSGGDGAILILGTGSCALAHVGGEFHVVGGWGFPLSDQASGAWMGLQLLSHTLTVLDGLAPASPLSERIASHFDHSRARFVSWQNTAQPRDYAGFAPWVYETPADPLAARILNEQAEWISRFVVRLRTLGASHTALMGGLAQVVLPHLPNELHPYLQPPQGDAMDGALYMARHGTGFTA